MPRKGSLILSQLPGYHRARKVAELIVHQKSAILESLYTKTDKPETFVSMAEEVRPDSEPKSTSSKFIKSVIHIALKNILGQEKMTEINAIRDRYFAEHLWDTIKQNGGQKVVDKIRFLAGKKTRAKNREKLSVLYKERVKEQGFSPWYDDEISFLDGLLVDPSYYYTSGSNMGDPDYSKIVPLLNKFFYNGETIRNASTVGSFLYKRARSHRSDDEISYLQNNKNITNSHAMARHLNETHHDGLCIRTASAVDCRIKKQQQEEQKMIDLGITKQ